MCLMLLDKNREQMKYFFSPKGMLAWVLVTFYCLALPIPAAAISLVNGDFTGISSSADGMISFRHQERYWVSTDGAQHLLVNLGADQEPSSLVLMTRPPDSNSWQVAFVLPNTNQTSSADSLQGNNQLRIVYSDAEGGIRFALANYDIGSGQWQAPTVSQVYDGTNNVGRGPTLVFDGDGVAYVAFTATERAITGRINIRLYSRQAPLDDWQDTGKRWGHLNIAAGKSARLVATSDGIGLIYTDQFRNASGTVSSSLNWSVPADAGSVGGAWVDQEIHHLIYDGRDPFGSHFNVVGDKLGNLYLVWAISKKVRYFRYQGSSRAWNYSDWLLPYSHRAAYVQITRHSDGRLYAVFNFGAYLVVMESLDNGFVFDLKALLWHPNRLNQDWTHPRVETPQLFSGTLNILQQVAVGSSSNVDQTLYQYGLNP